MLTLVLTACGNKQTEDINSDTGLIDDLVKDETTNNKNEETKPKGEKPKDNNSETTEDYGDALDGFNIQKDEGKVQLKQDKENIVSSGNVTDTSLGDMSHMKENNTELQASSGMKDLNIQRFMYETNADMVNINVLILDYMENGCSEGKLNGLISKVDLLTTRNNYIQSRMSSDLDILSAWNNYYKFIKSLKESISKLEVSQADMEQLNNLTSAVNICFSTRLVGYNYMEDLLSSPIETEDNTVTEEDINIDNEVTEETENQEENVENTEDIEENNTIENSETEDTEIEVEEDNTVPVE